MIIYNNAFTGLSPPASTVHIISCNPPGGLHPGHPGLHPGGVTTRPFYRRGKSRHKDGGELAPSPAVSEY